LGLPSFSNNYTENVFGKKEDLYQCLHLRRNNNELRITITKKNFCLVERYKLNKKKQGENKKKKPIKEEAGKPRVHAITLFQYFFFLFF